MKLINADKLYDDGFVQTHPMMWNVIESPPVVEAIPVEWLEQLLDDAELAGQPYTINILKRILSRWEKENGN